MSDNTADRFYFRVIHEDDGAWRIDSQDYDSGRWSHMATVESAQFVGGEIDEEIAEQLRRVASR